MIEYNSDRKEAWYLFHTGDPVKTNIVGIDPATGFYDIYFDFYGHPCNPKYLFDTKEDLNRSLPIDKSHWGRPNAIYGVGGA